jgi:hypothetical protein
MMLLITMHDILVLEIFLPINMYFNMMEQFTLLYKIG